MLERPSGRDESGKFLPGHAPINPTRPYGRYSETIRMLNDKYTASQLRAMSADPVTTEDFTPIEMIAFKHLVNSLSDLEPTNYSHVSHDRDSLIDRLEGPVKNNNAVDVSAKLVIELRQIGKVPYDTGKYPQLGTQEQTEGVQLRIAQEPQISDA